MLQAAKPRTKRQEAMMAKQQQLRARDLDYPEPPRRHRAGRLAMHTPELSAPSPIPTPAQKARRPSFPSPRVSLAHHASTQSLPLPWVHVTCTPVVPPAYLPIKGLSMNGDRHCHWSLNAISFNPRSLPVRAFCSSERQCCVPRLST